MIERLFTFAKAQVSSFTGGIVDYFVMILCTEYLHIHYIISIAIGGIIGAIVNFSINKEWTFRSKGQSYKHSDWKLLFRFSLVVINSIILKASGTFLITSFVHIDYKFSRIFTDMAVSLIFNYNLQRHWVFQRNRI